MRYTEFEYCDINDGDMIYLYCELMNIKKCMVAETQNHARLKNKIKHKTTLFSQVMMNPIAFILILHCYILYMYTCGVFCSFACIVIYIHIANMSCDML